MHRLYAGIEESEKVLNSVSLIKVVVVVIKCQWYSLLLATVVKRLIVSL